ncbi:MAG: hypothetical protein IPP71_16625 [Bacteroidetes bacterium]|nr:hypothetical protein [Bacteroidota bacterium]
MKGKILIRLLVVLVFITNQGMAQKGNLGDEQINVVKAYQPTLSDAFKISDIGRLCSGNEIRN